MAIACTLAMSWCALAQRAEAPNASSKSTTLIGCLSGPDADDHYTLTSMQHRAGVLVVGGEDLQKGAGAKVKLAGSWEALPGSEGKKQSDLTRRFRATELTVMDEKCQPPAPVTPVSKKKQEKQKAQQNQ